jgi:hypothetical protein
MNTFICNTDSYNRIKNGIFYSELEELCKISFNLLYKIKLYIFIVKAKFAARRMIKTNDKFIKYLYQIEYVEVKNCEKMALEILNLLALQSSKHKVDENIKCIRIFNKIFVNPINNSFKSVVKSINESYHFNAKEIFESDKDYKENNEALKVFADLWDDETPDEDKEQVFNYNAESKHAL